MVIKGPRKIVHLCVIQDTTVTSDATASTLSLSDNEITRPWYMRLRHRSDNGMAELSEKDILDK